VALLSCFAKASQDGALYNLTRKSGPASLAAVQRASQGHSAKLASGERSRVEAAGIEPASREMIAPRQYEKVVVFPQLTLFPKMVPAEMKKS
tara:strand:- start:244 stop:519 length:276 start_codon:yes stop_codon:yes gene_type:complete